MPDRRAALGAIGVGITAAIAGVLVASREFEASPTGAATALLATRFSDLAGNSRAVSEWAGKVLVVNFWATWCPPCREEIPALVRARDKWKGSGVEFIGIGIDQGLKIREFARNVPISYPLLVAEANGLEVMRRLGNPSGGLPFTIVLNAKGGIAQRNLGAVTQEKIEAQIATALSS